jgi:hypothetical protein
MNQYVQDHLICSAVILLTILAGCVQESANLNDRDSESDANPSLIAKDYRQHDFGVVVGKPEQKLSHRYRLANATPHDIKIVDIINRKPCCGIVRIGMSTLRPGDVTDVEITLVVGDRFGAVVNETEVITDCSSEPGFVLRTSATAQPAFRVEELSRTGEAILIGTNNSQRAEFRLFASGTSAEPPADLDHLTLESTIKVDWVGLKEESPSDDGLRVFSRRYAKSLDSTGKLGEREIAILLKEGNHILHRHAVHWEVLSPITISPKVVVITRNKRNYSALIQSHDDRSFRITRIESSVASVRVWAVNTTAALTQMIELEGVPQSHEARPVVTIFTDHPAQEKVELPILVID